MIVPLNFRLLWNCLTVFNETRQEARSQRLLRSLFVCLPIGKSKCPGLWFAETFSTSPPKPLNGIQWNWIGSKITTYSTKFVFIGLLINVAYHVISFCLRIKSLGAYCFSVVNFNFHRRRYRLLVWHAYSTQCHWPSFPPWFFLFTHPPWGPGV